MITPETLAGAAHLVEFLSENLKHLVKTLNDAKIEIQEGAIIDYASSEIEYRIHILIGDFYERAKPDSQILAKFQSFLQGKARLENVLEIWGIGLKYGENLRKLGIITLEGSMGSISFKELLSNVKSEFVIISIREKISQELLMSLVSTRFTRTTRRTADNKLEGIFTVALDYANLWSKKLTSFSVRNIVFSFEVLVYDESIESAFSESFRRRVISAFRGLQRGDNNSIRFITVVSRVFLTFESQEIIAKLSRTFSVDPLDKGEIVETIPAMEHAVVAGVNYPVTVPGKVTLKLRTQIEESEIVSKGKIIFDLKRFHAIIREMVDRIDRETRGFKI